MKVERHDSAKAGKAVKLDNGFLRLPITATRTGIFIYKDSTGKEFRELRPPEEVFHPDSMESLANVLFTNEHPREMINSKNAKTLGVGFVSDRVVQAGNFLKTFATIHDEATIADIDAKRKKEVSCGYHSELDFTPGSWNGQHYDAIQRKIRYNHVALVPKGRAGADVKVHTDSADTDGRVMRFDSVIDIEPAGPNNPPNKGENMKTLLVNGIEIQLEDKAYDAVVGQMKTDSKTITGLQEKLDAASTEKTGLQAKFDAADTDLKAAKAELADKAKFDSAVRNRIKLETFAAKHLDAAKEKLDSLSDADIVVKLIQLKNKDFKIDSIAEADRPTYLKSRLDHMMEQPEPKGGAITQLEKNLKTKANNDSADVGGERTAEQARRERMDSQKNAWQQPIGYGLNRK